jgi:hypothetical protein
MMKKKRRRKKRRMELEKRRRRRRRRNSMRRRKRRPSLSGNLWFRRLRLGLLTRMTLKRLMKLMQVRRMMSTNSFLRPVVLQLHAMHHQ